MMTELSHDEIERLLHSELVGRIGCHVNGETYVVPITYVYEDGTVYAHSVDGRKLKMMRTNPDVCFEVDHMAGLASWRSVIAWGKFEELTGVEASRGLRLLMNRLWPLAVDDVNQPSHGMAESGTHRTDGVGTVIYCIRLTKKTGRLEQP